MVPRRILVMRFQATGDVVITLPWLQSLHDQSPDTEIHFLTRREAGSIPDGLTMFTKVIQIGGGRNTRLQLLHVLILLPFLKLQGYDVVIDLQNHWISRMIRKFVAARVWSEFDRGSPTLAGERSRLAISAAGFATVAIPQELKLKKQLANINFESETSTPYVILNPAGAFDTRHWPLQRYIDFANRWLSREPGTRFMILGLSSMTKTAAFFRDSMGKHVIDLVDMTTGIEAFKLVRGARLVLTEDSGLLHMAWTQRVPTVAIFGSTRSDWSAPMGDWSYCFNSSDLPCGNCMLEKCKFHDNHCLTRWTVDQIYNKAVELVTSNEKSR